MAFLSRWLAPLLLVGGLAACAQTPPPPPPTPPVIAAKPAKPPAKLGHYKLGVTYEKNGQVFTPREDMSYDVVGEASWYGPGFHGKETANGELFDMNDLTAAHPTLPLPSVVRVTNLDNERSVVVRVNDRGPFHEGRIIDLSRRAAQLLGIKGVGTATVRVQILADPSRREADKLIKLGRACFRC